MSEKEITNEELAEEDQTEENDGYSDLAELFGAGEEEEENEYDDENLIQEEECYGEIVKTVTEIAQPIETFVEVGAKELANGKLTPFCKFSIKRNITEKTDEFEVIDDDFETLIERVKETMSRFQEE